MKPVINYFKKRRLTPTDLKFELFFILSLALLFTSCTNSILQNNIVSVPTTTPNPSASSTSKQDVINISFISITASANNTTSPAPSPTPTSSNTSTATSYLTYIYFDNSTSTAPISSHCNMTTSSNSSQIPKPCLCQFTWTEVNPYAGGVTGGTSPAASIPRTVQTSPIEIQDYRVYCNAPGVYGTEILDNTQIIIKVIPASGNPDASSFTTNSYSFVKNSQAVTGSFTDANGQIFDNILHYSCYEKVQRSLAIRNKTILQTNTNTQETRNVFYASDFCVRAGSSSSAGSTLDCPNSAPLDYSSQANYYNFFIRNSERGNINISNGNFFCPMVKERIDRNSNVGSQNQAWPLDTTFALSIGWTPTFNVGVKANTEINIGEGSTQVSTDCSPGQSSTSSSSSSNGASSIIQSCLGFAAQPNPDGTCPTIKDSSGLTRLTYRLRRYVAVYPKLYNSNGRDSLPNPNQGIDTIFVLDRPVNSSTNPNPLKPFTMRGPKPCPFAYFDAHGLTNPAPHSAPFPIATATPINPTLQTKYIGIPRYAGTNHAGWAGKNVDGIEFPNYDNSPDSTSEASCSSALPIIDKSQSKWSIMTVNINSTNPANQHIYIRPFQPFTPHYEEDTSFLACAPAASPVIKDAPLHFALDPITGNVAWCTEAYPTQNQNISALDPPLTPTPIPSIPSGLIANYTSHVAKNSGSAQCSATQISLNTATYNYDAVNPSSPQFAKHPAGLIWENNVNANQTCDRTVMSQTLDWPKFPLLAPSADVEAGIQSDSSYFCSMTYDANGFKTKQNPPQSPSSGCCSQSANVAVVSTTNPGNNNITKSAHLEPDVPCGVPNY